MNQIKIQFADYEYELDGLSDSFKNYLEGTYIFEYDPETTIKELLLFLYEKDPFNSHNSCNEMEDIGTERLRIKFRNEYLEVIGESKVYKLVEYLGKPDIIQMIYIIGLGGGGEVEYETTRKMGFKLIFHSNEANHAGRPHVHAYDLKNGDKATIDLLSFEIIAGKMKGGRYMLLRYYLENNNDKYLEYWNKLTNGIKVGDKYIG